MQTEPHFGCPKCGSPKFTASQDVTEYCTETAYCTYTSQEPDVIPDFERDETDNRDCYDSEVGDIDDVRTCQECSHEYTEPVFYAARDTLEDIAKRSGLEVKDVEPLAPFLEAMTHATIRVSHEPHATVITATPRSIRRGNGSLHSWMVYECCRCGAEMEEKEYCTRQAYRQREGGLTNREKALDRRLLPVLIRASLCRHCP